MSLNIRQVIGIWLYCSLHLSEKPIELGFAYKSKCMSSSVGLHFKRRKLQCCDVHPGCIIYWKLARPTLYFFP